MVLAAENKVGQKDINVSCTVKKLVSDVVCHSVKSVETSEYTLCVDRAVEPRDDKNIPINKLFVICKNSRTRFTIDIVFFSEFSEFASHVVCKFSREIIMT
jgi:hypothetical protein